MIVVTFIFLSIVLLDHKCHYWLSRIIKDNINCKTFLYCTREINLSLKLFLVLKRNDNVIKTLFALYLISIYVEYMYSCEHMCIMNLHVIVGKYAFSFFPCYLVLTMTTPSCLYPIISFNKADWSYL